MIGEVELGGVFLPTILVSGIVGFMATIAARHALRVAGAYRFIWHAGLFDVAMFVILWCSAVLVGARIYGWVGL